MRAICRSYSARAGTEEGTPINVDGDKLSLELAIDLGAEAIYFFSDTPGLLADKDDESTLIREIDVTDPEAAIESAQGRMKVKVESALKAIERGSVGSSFPTPASLTHRARARWRGHGDRAVDHPTI